MQSGPLFYRDTCGKCGAVRVDRQIGLEATPDEYLATMVAVFREVRRVLRRDGTVWCNLGDSYAGGNTVGWRAGNPDMNGGASNRDGVGNVPGLAAKQLLLMPARLALALQADGWWVRSDIIWHKPNPMPESVTDRCVSAHEHVFMLTKSARYFFDATAIAEPVSDTNGAHAWRRIFDPSKQSKEAALKDAGIKGGNDGARDPSATHRACRNVWTIATSPFSAAHFATYPPELAERCIKAGTSERGCCAACGKPWVRESTKTYEPTERTPAPNKGHLRVFGEKASGMTASGFIPNRDPVIETTGWARGCQCGTTETRPCTVLDPFAGAGTTLLVADRLQRDAIGIELNTAYTEMAMERCRADAPLFTSFPPAEDPEETRMADLFTDMAAD